MANATESFANGNISRRRFMGGSVALAVSALSLSAFGCSPGTSVEKKEEPAEHAEIANPEADGTWVSVACWHNCGGRCMNKVMVKDGAVIRQKTDDTHEDSAEYPQQRGCVRGKAQQQQCFGADRILHPLKRKGWQPGGGENANGAMRGKDEWEAISWDEAIKLSCQEIERIRDQYGNTGFYSKSADAFLNAIGGAITSWETQSFGTYSFDTTLYGLPSRDLGMANDRFDMQNADYVVMYASNPNWSAAGTPTYYYIQAHEAGVKFVTVDPMYNATAQMLDADWIPVRMGTDIAFMLAAAYEMLRLDDEEGGIVDWDFLNAYTVGFDADHMPADATMNENLKGYILGEYDGVPKTPEWAETICGAPASQITEFARLLGKDNKVMILHNYGMARAHGTDNVSQMLMTLGAMGGHMGKSGHCCGSAYHANCGNAGDPLVSAGSAKAQSKLKNTVTMKPRTSEILKIIKEGGGSFGDVGGYGSVFHAPEEVTVGEVKGIFHISEASLQTSPDQKMNIEAHRAVDFVLTRAQFMTTNARYSDIILPVTTEWETVGGVTASNREFVVCYSQVTEPLGESKTDQEIGTLLLEGMGIDPGEAYPSSEQQRFFDQIAGSTVRSNGGDMVPLVTVSDADIAEWGVEGKAQEGIVGLQEFIDNGGYQFERKKDDGLGFVGYEDFVKDPAANPLPSASGKFEIYCQAHYDLHMSLEYPNAEAYKPYPVYVVPPAPAGYAATFENNDVEAGVKGDYPYLMYNPHYLRRSHTVFDNCPWLRETWPNPVFLNRKDAEKEGIAEGDTVLVSTAVGQVLRRAMVMDMLIPGVVGVPHGAWVDVDEKTGIDHAGSDNYLIGSEYSGMGVTGYNNLACAIEKYTKDSIPLDCDMPARFVEA